MKKKILSVLLCVSMVAATLVGCGASANEGGSTADGETAKDGGKLVYWAMWSEDEPQAKVIKEAIAKYEADTGVTVDVQFKGRNGQREGLQPALDAKQTIDLFDEDVNRVNGSWGKYLLDLEDVAKDYEAEHGNAVLFQIARNAGGGTLKTIPYQPSIFGFFYNKTLFAQAGIDTVPATWDELDAACAKLKEAGITPITGDTAYYPSFFGYHMGRYLGQDGVKALVNDPALDEEAAAAVNWDDPRVLQGANDFADFAKKGYFSENIATNIYPAGQNQEFAPGTAAIVICGSWLPNEIKASVSPELEWGYFNYPSVNGGTDGNTANNIANQVFGINKDSKMVDQAMELITYITAGEFDKKMTQEALCIPTDKANTEWPAELAAVKDPFDSTTVFYDWAVGLENNGDLTPVLSENLIKLMAGDIDGAAFVEACASAIGE